MGLPPRIPPAACGYDGRDATPGPVPVRPRAARALAGHRRRPGPEHPGRRAHGRGRDRPAAPVATSHDRLAGAEADGAVVVLQIDTSGTIDQDGVALAQHGGRSRRPDDRVGRARAREGRRRRAAADVRELRGGGLARLADRAALADRPRAPRAGLPGPRRDDRRVAAGARTSRSRTGDDEHPMPAPEAIDAGIASVAATSVPELLNAVDGTTVADGRRSGRRCRRGSRPTSSRRTSAPSTSASTTWARSMRVAHAVASPSMIYFLLVFGLACLAFEMTQPGFGFAGFAGVGMVALAAYGIWVVPPFWPGMLLLVGGVGLDDARRPDPQPRAASRRSGCSRSRPVRCSRGTAWPTRSGSRLADRRRDGREPPLLRVRAHRGDAVARPHREHPARADRAGRARRAASSPPRAPST